MNLMHAMTFLSSPQSNAFFETRKSQKTSALAAASVCFIIHLFVVLLGFYVLASGRLFSLVDFLSFQEPESCSLPKFPETHTHFSPSTSAASSRSKPLLAYDQSPQQSSHSRQQKPGRSSTQRADSQQASEHLPAVPEAAAAHSRASSTDFLSS